MRDSYKWIVYGQLFKEITRSYALLYHVFLSHLMPAANDRMRKAVWADSMAKASGMRGEYSRLTGSHSKFSLMKV
jgi:hypothetical protein